MNIDELLGFLKEEYQRLLGYSSDIFYLLKMYRVKMITRTLKETVIACLSVRNLGLEPFTPTLVNTLLDVGCQGLLIRLHKLGDLRVLTPIRDKDGHKYRYVFYDNFINLVRERKPEILREFRKDGNEGKKLGE